MFINDANREEVSKICSSIFVCLDILLIEEDITTKLAGHMPENHNLKNKIDLVNNIYDLLLHDDFSETRNNIPQHLQDHHVFMVRQNMANQLVASETAKQLTGELIEQLKICDVEFINELLQHINTLDNHTQKACCNLIQALVHILGRVTRSESRSSSDSEHSSNHDSDSSSHNEHRHTRSSRHHRRGRNHGHAHNTYGNNTYSHTYGHGNTYGHGHTYGHGTYGNCTYGNHDHCHDHDEHDHHNHHNHHHGHSGDIHYHLHFHYHAAADNSCEQNNNDQYHNMFIGLQQKFAEMVELLRQNIHAPRSQHSPHHSSHTSDQRDPYFFMHTIGAGMKKLGNTLWSFGHSISKAACGPCMGRNNTAQSAANDSDVEQPAANDSDREQPAAPVEAPRASLTQV